MAKKQYLDLAGVQALWTKICANDDTLKDSIKDIADVVEILNGSAEVAGSVQNIVNTAIADRVDSTKIQELKDSIDALVTRVNTNKNDIADLKTITDVLAVDGIEGTTLKDKIDAEIEANFEVIDIDSLNLTWN